MGVQQCNNYSLYSAGLFHGVIGESGSALEHWSHDPDPIGSAILIAWYNGCTSEVEDLDVQLDEIFDCMMNKTDDELAMNMAAFVVCTGDSFIQ